MANYIALVHKSTTSDFAVTFLDLPGCVAASSTLVGLFANATEALALHIEGLAEDGSPLPEPTSLHDYLRSSDRDPSVPILLIG